MTNQCFFPRVNMSLWCKKYILTQDMKANGKVTGAVLTQSPLWLSLLVFISLQQFSTDYGFGVYNSCPEERIVWSWPSSGLAGALLVQPVWPVACRIRKGLGSINKYVARLAFSEKSLTWVLLVAWALSGLLKDDHLRARESWKRLD